MTSSDFSASSIIGAMAFGVLVGAVGGAVLGYSLRPGDGSVTGAFGAGLGGVLLAGLVGVVGGVVGTAVAFVQILGLEAAGRWFKKRKLPFRDFLLEASTVLALVNAGSLVALTGIVTGQWVAPLPAGFVVGVGTALGAVLFGRQAKADWDSVGEGA